MSHSFDNANTSGLDAFLAQHPRTMEGEEQAEKAWMAHVNRGHETWMHGIPKEEYPPIKPHPTDNGKPLKDTRLWPDKRRR